MESPLIPLQNMRKHLLPFRMEDLPRYVALLQACEQADRVGRAHSIESITHMLTTPGVNTEQGIWLIPESSEESAPLIAAGFVLLLPMFSADTLATAVNVRPEYRGQGLEQELLTFLEEQAWEVPNIPRPIKVMGFAEGAGNYQHKLYQDNGYQPIRWFLELVRDLKSMQKEDGAGIEAPAGLTIRSLKPETLDQDIADLHLALTEAFKDHWNPTEMTLEQTRHMILSPHFRPELTLLAYDGKGEVAGACLNEVRTEYNRQNNACEAMVDELGVRRPYRRRGLAHTLLLRSFQLFCEAGLDSAALMVDSENPTGAMRLYESVGFVERKRSAVYEKTLPDT